MLRSALLDKKLPAIPEDDMIILTRMQDRVMHMIGQMPRTHTIAGVVTFRHFTSIYYDKLKMLSDDLTLLQALLRESRIVQQDSRREI